MFYSNFQEIFRPGIYPEAFLFYFDILTGLLTFL
jgi:hypothetical protein